MPHIYTKRMIEGESLLGIIRNGNYYLSQFDIYEDGTVNCWERYDLPHFKEAIERKKVVPSVPIGENLSIFGLAVLPIQQAKWLYNPKTYYNYIVSIVKQLNPEMQNIYTMSKRVAEKWEKHRVGWSDTAIDCKVKEFIGYRLTDGKSIYIFYHTNKKTFLTLLTVYADKTFAIATVPDKFYTMKEIRQLFSDGKLSTTVKPDTWVQIDGLGSIQFGESVYSVATEEKLKELEELLKRLRKEPTAHEACVNAYHEYLEYPCDATREYLRKAYEAVPEHERCYLGDMDTRDTDYQRILYHPDQKREV